MLHPTAPPDTQYGSHLRARQKLPKYHLHIHNRCIDSQPIRRLQLMQVNQLCYRGGIHVHTRERPHIEGYYVG